MTKFFEYLPFSRQLGFALKIHLANHKFGIKCRWTCKLSRYYGAQGLFTFNVAVPIQRRGFHSSVVVPEIIKEELPLWLEGVLKHNEDCILAPRQPIDDRNKNQHWKLNNGVYTLSKTGGHDIKVVWVQKQATSDTFVPQPNKNPFINCE